MPSSPARYPGYKDVNGDGVINNDDQMPIGYSQLPQNHLWFLHPALPIKDSIAQCCSREPAKLPYTWSKWRVPFDTDWRNAMSVHMERWNEERYKAGENITFPWLSHSHLPATTIEKRSSYWLKDASYLRLKNVEVGYTLYGWHPETRKDRQRAGICQWHEPRVITIPVVPENIRPLKRRMAAVSFIRNKRYTTWG